MLVERQYVYEYVLRHQLTMRTAKKLRWLQLQIKFVSFLLVIHPSLLQWPEEQIEICTSKNTIIITSWISLCYLSPPTISISIRIIYFLLPSHYYFLMKVIVINNSNILKNLKICFRTWIIWMLPEDTIPIHTLKNMHF